MIESRQSMFYKHSGLNCKSRTEESGNSQKSEISTIHVYRTNGWIIIIIEKIPWDENIRYATY